MGAGMMRASRLPVAKSVTGLQLANHAVADRNPDRGFVDRHRSVVVSRHVYGRSRQNDPPDA